MTIIVKPTVQELIDAYTRYQKAYTDHTISQEDWHDIADTNQQYLENITQSDYNQETFKV